MKHRGMIKWQPFASLPEQAGYIKSLMHDINKIDKPILSEDQLQYLNNQLYRFYESQSWVNLEYYHDGYLYVVEGIIKKIDLIRHSITVENNGKRDKFSISSIIDIHE